MGEQQSRKKRFLAKHPLCCFCGGGTPATTEDHWPSRAIFIGRKWPEGYVFPACGPCNSATRLDEPLMALICRIRFPDIAGDPAEWHRLLKGIRYTMPEVAASMAMSTTEKRAALREKGLELPVGQTYKDLPIASIAHPRFHEAAERFAQKLFSSLYYKHTGRILGPHGRIIYVWRTNTFSFEEFFKDAHMRQLLVKFPKLTREGRPLNDQFFYKYNVAEVEPPAAVFGVVFNHAVAMLGVVMGDVSQVAEAIPESARLRPFRWS